MGLSSATAAGSRCRSSILKCLGRRSRSCRSRQPKSSARGRHSSFCAGVGTDRLALPTWMALVLSVRCRASQNHAPTLSVSGPAPLLSRQLRLEPSIGAPSSAGSQNSTRLPRQLFRHAVPQHKRNASSRPALALLLVPCVVAAGSKTWASSPDAATSAGRVCGCGGGSCSSSSSSSALCSGNLLTPLTLLGWASLISGLCSGGDGGDGSGCDVDCGGGGDGCNGGGGDDGGGGQGCAASSGCCPAGSRRTASEGATNSP